MKTQEERLGSARLGSARLGSARQDYTIGTVPECQAKSAAYGSPVAPGERGSISVLVHDGYTHSRHSAQHQPSKYHIARRKPRASRPQAPAAPSMAIRRRDRLPAERKARQAATRLPKRVSVADPSTRPVHPGTGTRPRKTSENGRPVAGRSRAPPRGVAHWPDSATRATTSTTKAAKLGTTRTIGKTPNTVPSLLCRPDRHSAVSICSERRSASPHVHQTSSAAAPASADSSDGDEAATDATAIRSRNGAEMDARGGPDG